MIGNFFQRALIWRRCIAKVDVHFAAIWLQLLACVQFTGINSCVVAIRQPHVDIAQDLLQSCVLSLPLLDEHLGRLHMLIISVPRISVASVMNGACVNHLSPPNAETALEVTLLLVALLLLSEMILLSFLTDLLLLLGSLALLAPIGTHLFHIFHHLVITSAFWFLRTILGSLFQPFCEVRAFLDHVVEEHNFCIPAFRVSLALLVDFDFQCCPDAGEGLLLIFVALFDRLDVVVHLLLGTGVGLHQSVFQLLGEPVNGFDLGFLWPFS